MSHGVLGACYRYLNPSVNMSGLFSGLSQAGWTSCCPQTPQNSELALMLLSGVVEPWDGPSPCWLVVLGPASSELALEAVREGRKITKQTSSPSSGPAPISPWPERHWQGCPEDLLPGFAWPQTSGMWLFACYRYPHWHRHCTPRCLCCCSSRSIAGGCLLQLPGPGETNVF